MKAQNKDLDPSPAEMQNPEAGEDSTTAQTEIIFHTIILIHCLLYLIKILFELSLGISRITNFLELLNLGTLLVIAVTKYVEVGLKSTFMIDFSNPNAFYDF